MAQSENGVPGGTDFMDTTSTGDQGPVQIVESVNAEIQNATTDKIDINCKTEEQSRVDRNVVRDGDENSSFFEDVSCPTEHNLLGVLPEEDKENDKLDGEKGPEDQELLQRNIEVGSVDTEVTPTDCNEMSDTKSIDAISLADIKASFMNNQEMGDGDCKNVDNDTGNRTSEIIVSVDQTENDTIGGDTKTITDSSMVQESSISDIKTGNSDSGSISLVTDNGCSNDAVSASVENESNKSEHKGASNYAIQPGELTNKLIEGPSITLPLSEISNRNSSASVGNTVCASENKASTSSSSNSSDLSLGSIPTASGSDSQQHNNLRSHSNETTDVMDSSKQVNNTPSSPAAVTHSSSTPAPAKRVKKTPDDFIFGKLLGEGSYSTVYLAKEVSTQREFAVKVCEKKHLIREKKTHFVMREKEVLMKLDHPFFIKLAYTFQDTDRLYYVLTYARNGELLDYLNKLSVFDVPCTRFYSAEVVIALEYLQSLGIVHRDLKPENILLGEDMHIKISDFGTSKFINGTSVNTVGTPDDKQRKRKHSFVGTAEYVSPEVLNGEAANYGTDLWALACIIYQCLSSCLPFRSGNEYQTFQKILKLDYEFPEGFHEDAKDLVQKLLVLEPTERLGMKQPDGMEALKNHPFFEGIEWASLPTTTPPKLLPYLPATANNPEFWGEQEQRTGFDDQRLAEIITGQSDRSMSPELEPVSVNVKGTNESAELEKLEKQRQENSFHQFVENNLILRQGFVDKRKGFFARKRMLLLTEGPHLYYVDAHNKVLKGEIPWSKELRTEAKNFKIFFVHTPNRTYYLESRHPDAHHWVKRIQEVWNKYYGNGDDQDVNKGS